MGTNTGPERRLPATADGSGVWSFETAALSEGAHGFTAKATDAAGNTSEASAALGMTIDTSAPTAPVITGVADDSGTVGDGITNDSTLVLSAPLTVLSTGIGSDGPVSLYDSNDPLGMFSTLPQTSVQIVGDKILVTIAPALFPPAREDASALD